MQAKLRGSKEVVPLRGGDQTCMSRPVWAERGAGVRLVAERGGHGDAQGGEWGQDAPVRRGRGRGWGRAGAWAWAWAWARAWRKVAGRRVPGRQVPKWSGDGWLVRWPGLPGRPVARLPGARGSPGGRGRPALRVGPVARAPRRVARGPGPPRSAPPPPLPPPGRSSVRRGADPFGDRVARGDPARLRDRLGDLLGVEGEFAEHAADGVGEAGEVEAGGVLRGAGAVDDRSAARPSSTSRWPTRPSRARR